MFKGIPNLKEKNVTELQKEFETVFNQLSLKHSHYSVFEDYLNMSINGFCFNYDRELMNYLQKKYTQEERYYFGELIKIWVLICDKKVIDNNTFYDWFGNFYEQNSMSKKNGFAQYFTPAEICKFMAQILHASNPDPKTICEPTCGSGRLNLAAHSLNHKLTHFANDLDYTCVKMAALNFMIHGIKGIVICDDGLFPGTKFKGAFLVNIKRAPYIQYIDDVKSAYFYADYLFPTQKKHTENNIQKTPEETLQEEYKIVADKKGQLAFDF